MTVVKWEPSFATGDPQVDQEHMDIFALVAALEQLVEAGAPSARYNAAAVDDILTYARTHFGHEEALMDRFAYPDVEHHKEQHREFAFQAEELRRECDMGTCAALDGLAAYMTTWFEHHIQTEDKRLVEWLHANGHVPA